MAVNKKVNWINVGASVPQHFANYLALFAHQKGISKSALIRSLIQSLREEGPSVEELLESITDNQVMEWNRRQNINAGFDQWESQKQLQDRLDEFLKETRDQLNKNLPNHLSKEILKRVKKLCKEQIKRN